MRKMKGREATVLATCSSSSSGEGSSRGCRRWRARLGVGSRGRRRWRVRLGVGVAGHRRREGSVGWLGKWGSPNIGWGAALQ